MYKDGRTSPLGIKTVAAVELHLWQINTKGLIMNFLYKTGEKKTRNFEFVADAYIVQIFQRNIPLSRSNDTYSKQDLSSEKNEIDSNECQRQQIVFNFDFFVAYFLVYGWPNFLNRFIEFVLLFE